MENVTSSVKAVLVVAYVVLTAGGAEAQPDFPAHANDLPSKELTLREIVEESKRLYPSDRMAQFNWRKQYRLQHPPGIPPTEKLSGEMLDRNFVQALQISQGYEPVDLGGVPRYPYNARYVSAAPGNWEFWTPDQSMQVHVFYTQALAGNGWRFVKTNQQTDGPYNVIWAKLDSQVLTARIRYRALSIPPYGTAVKIQLLDGRPKPASGTSGGMGEMAPGQGGSMPGYVPGGGMGGYQAGPQ